MRQGECPEHSDPRALGGTGGWRPVWMRDDEGSRCGNEGEE